MFVRNLLFFRRKMSTKVGKLRTSVGSKVPRSEPCMNSTSLVNICDGLMKSFQLIRIWYLFSVSEQSSSSALNLWFRSFMISEFGIMVPGSTWCKAGVMLACSLLISESLLTRTLLIVRDIKSLNVSTWPGQWIVWRLGNILMSLARL